MIKTCSRCNEEKDISLFQVRKASIDGYTAACKACLSAYDKSRANLPRRVNARNEYAKTKRGQSATAQAKKRYIERNPIKRAAHVMVGNAIRSGILIRRPCDACGSDLNIHGHHDDYAHPLVVRWLCVDHHVEWHKNNKPLFGGQPIEDSEWEHITDGR